MQEKIDYLQRIFKVPKSQRNKVIQELPPHLHWLSICKKPQTIYIILKFILDDECQKIYNWPAHDEKCDFCISGNLASAQMKLHECSLDFNVDIFAWWKRYVRQVCCIKNNSGENVIQFNLINKPNFFTQNDKKLETQQLFIEKQKDCYRCSVCSQPKRGHVCEKKNTKKIAKDEEKEYHDNETETDLDTEEKFEDFFVEESALKKNKRLFPMNVSTCTTTKREMMPTEFILHDD